MTRLIDADALIDSLNIRSATYNCIINKCIEDAPTIDAVEVVRCGECEYWKCNPNSERNWLKIKPPFENLYILAKEYGVCKKVSYDDFEVVMNSDDFCSYGIREKNKED